MKIKKVVLILKSRLFQTNLVTHFKCHHSYLRIDLAKKTELFSLASLCSEPVITQ